MKNKYLKQNAVCMLVSLLIIFSGCNDDAFLKENPPSFYTVDNIISSSDQVDQLITSCYRMVKDIYCPYNNSSELALWSYRMGNGTDIFDVPTIRLAYRFNDYSIITSLTNVFDATFSAFYQLINSANYALYASEKVTWESAEKRPYAEAQARFFRAFAYRNLAELFGGVPLVTEINLVPRYDFTRVTRMEIYQFAIDEMEAILNDFPETTPTAGRLVRAVVQHNLCQLYIDKGVLLAESGGDAIGSYQKALSYSNAIIDGGIYSLMTERFGTRRNENPDFYFSSNRANQIPERLYSAAGYVAPGNVFWDLFQEGNQDYQLGNKEAIWVAQCNYAVRRTDGVRAGIMYAGIYDPVFRDQGATHLSGTMEDACGTGMVQVTPTAYTRDLIYADKWGDDMRNSEAVFRRGFYGNVTRSEYFGKPIPWSVLYKEENGVVNDAAYTMLFPASCKIAPDKFTGISDGENYTMLYRDDYLIRLPETILLRAEIKWRLGDKTGCAADINLLRSRANCSYLVTDADVSIELILDERVRELVYEESRWNTFLRMNDGALIAERIKKYSYWDYPRNTLNKTFTLWPIPQIVIDLNVEAVIEQNPDWK